MMRRQRSTLIGVVFVAVSSLSLAPPARAQYPQDAATAGAADTTVDAGQRVVLGGEGWQPGSAVQVRLPTVDLGTLVVDEAGQFSGPVRIPLGTGSGEQVVTVSGTSRGGEPSEIGVRLLVGGASAAPTEEVEFTSVNIGMWVLIALALVLVGVGAVSRGRRRLMQR